MNKGSEQWQGDLSSPDLDELSAVSELSSEALFEKRAALAAIVPKRTYGDGAETYQDFIGPQHADSAAVSAAAKELYWVRVMLGEIEQSYPNEDSDDFAKAAVLARRFLRDCRIEFQGMRETFVFWSETRNRYVQMDTGLHQKLVIKGQRVIGCRFEGHVVFVPVYVNGDLPIATHSRVNADQRAQAQAWLCKYPWRDGCVSLGQLFGTEQLEPNTQLWHAIRILKCRETFLETLQSIKQVTQPDVLSADEVASALKEASELSFVAGQSATALAKKDLEYDAVKSRDLTARRAQAGGHKSARNKTLRIESLLTALEKLGDFYPKISEGFLVQQASKDAIAENPSLWTQGQGQIDTYWSEIIRSVDPYKSRYYAIFGKSA